MAEYGRIVGQGSSVGGRGSGSGDLTGQVLDAISGAVDQVAALPPEILLGIIVAIMIGGMLLLRR